MKNWLVGALGMAAVMLMGNVALAQQKPPAGRSGLDPSSRGKVVNVLARARIDADGMRSRVEREVASSPGGRRNCSTNIGSAAQDNKPAIGNRYGSGRRDQVVVVQGPVVNLCK